MKENFVVMIENVSTQTIACQSWLYEVFNIPYKNINGKSDVRIFASQIQLHRWSFLTLWSAVQQAKNSLEMMANYLELNIQLEAFPQSSDRAKLWTFAISKGFISFKIISLPFIFPISVSYVLPGTKRI